MYSTESIFETVAKEWLTYSKNWVLFSYPQIAQKHLHSPMNKCIKELLER